MTAKKRKIIKRMCLSCRTNKDKRELIRIVRTPGGEIELDSTGKKSGRGAYLCPNPVCLKKAIRDKVLEKNLGRVLPKDVLELLAKKIDSFKR